MLWDHISGICCDLSSLTLWDVAGSFIWVSHTVTRDTGPGWRVSHESHQEIGVLTLLALTLLKFSFPLCLSLCPWSSEWVATRSVSGEGQISQSYGDFVVLFVCCFCHASNYCQTIRHYENVNFYFKYFVRFTRESMGLLKIRLENRSLTQSLYSMKE